MRVLLDECVPRSLRRELPDPEVSTVAEAGWPGVKNGALLKLAAQAFDAVVTVDRNLQYQQNLAGLEIAVVIAPVYRAKDVHAWLERLAKGEKPARPR